MSNLHIGKYSSILSAILLALAGITSVLAIKVPSLIFGFLLVPTFITMIASIHILLDEYKLFSLISVIFTGMYGVFVSFNYFFTLGFIGRGLEVPRILDMTEPDSIFIVIEVLGYFFMGLATLFLVPLFRKTTLDKCIAGLFFINGLLGIGGLVAFGLKWDLTIILWGLAAWNIIMPVAAILVYFHFKNMD